MKYSLSLPVALALVATMALTGCSGKASDAQPYSQRMVESLILQSFHDNQKTTSLDNAHFGYVPGLVAKSMLAAYNLYGIESYWEAAKAYADRQISDDAQQPLRIGDNDIDAINAGKIFFDLYRHSLETGDTESAGRYQRAATYMYDKLKFHHTRIEEPLPGAGGFIHKGRYPNQMWLDGLYMGAAFLAEYEATMGEGSAENWSDIAHQFITIHRYTWDADEQLNYHAWSADPTDANSFWAKKDGPYKGTSQEFWARGEGWYFAALADVLALMPQDHPDWQKLLDIYRQVAAGLARRQDQSGCWYQLLRYDNTLCADGLGDTVDGQTYNVGTLPNYLESSASSMFTYAFCKGLRLGFLPESYREVAEKAYKGLLDTFITENPDGSINILQSCASAGLGPAKSPSRTGTINYYLCGSDTGITNNEGKAIGAFTLACCAYELLTQQK